MCGIAGIWWRDGRHFDSQALHVFNRMLAHRGPDGEGIYLDGDLGLAHRRLAIVDLGPRAVQPMSSPDGRHCLVFNGEIHNYLELREELERLGEVFHSESDVEVLLTAYRRWGVSCFPRFNGMWAVAIWDRAARRLVLSRDRFGIKPLYYSSLGTRFAFASEVKAILANFPEEACMDEGEVFSFLVGASPDSGTSTFFRNVKCLPPASYLVVTADCLAEPVEYWTLDPDRRFDGDPVERFRFLFDDSVRLRMRSDVPVGICLSGGLDSSSVARRAIRAVSEPLHCFSLRYDDYPSIDESRFARLVADDPERYRVHWVTPSKQEFLPDLRRIVWHHDAPVPIRGRTAFWALMAEAGRRVRVTLTGEGSDELLAGYFWYLLPWFLDRCRKDGWSDWMRLRPVTELTRFLGGAGKSLPRALMSLAYPLLYLFRPHPEQGRWGIVDAHFARAGRKVDPHRFRHAWLRKDVQRPFPGYLNNALWLDFRSSGLPELLHQQDALGMAFSVECRPPFLDHRLVEFCFSLDFEQKMHAGRWKHLLRQAMKNDLPGPVVQRRSKLGMPTPYLALLTEPGTLREISDLLLGGELVRAGIVRRAAVGAMLKRLQSSALPITSELLAALWRCLTLELWHRQFLNWNRVDSSS